MKAVYDGGRREVSSESRGRVECKAARKAGGNQGDCIKGAGWSSIQGKIGAKREETQSDWCDRKNGSAG